LAERGLALPRPWQLPPDAGIPATLVRVTGTRVAVSAHVPLDDAGTIARPTGRVGGEVDLPAAQRAGVRSLLAILASLEVALGEPGRARVLRALGDGRALPASVLAFEAGVAPSTASEHLARLLAGGLLRVEPHGRHRYYRLAGPEVAAALEALARVAPPEPVR